MKKNKDILSFDGCNNEKCNFFSEVALLFLFFLGFYSNPQSIPLCFAGTPCSIHGAVGLPLRKWSKN